MNANHYQRKISGKEWNFFEKRGYQKGGITQGGNKFHFLTVYQLWENIFLHFFIISFIIGRYILQFKTNWSKGAKIGTEKMHPILIKKKLWRSFNTSVFNKRRQGSCYSEGIYFRRISHTIPFLLFWCSWFMLFIVHHLNIAYWNYEPIL